MILGNFECNRITTLNAIHFSFLAYIISKRPPSELFMKPFHLVIFETPVCCFLCTKFLWVTRNSYHESNRTLFPKYSRVFVEIKGLEKTAKMQIGCFGNLFLGPQFHYGCRNLVRLTVRPHASS